VLCGAAVVVVALAASASSTLPAGQAAAAPDAGLFALRIEPRAAKPDERRHQAVPVAHSHRHAPRLTARRRRAKAAAPAYARTPSTPQTRGRTFAWPPVPRARSYDVRLSRGGERIFEHAVAHAHIRIPAAWTFGGQRHTLAPGIYQWSVRPRYARSSHTRYGEAVVRAALTVTPADG